MDEQKSLSPAARNFSHG